MDITQYKFMNLTFYLLAVSSIDGSIDEFLRFLNKIFVLLAVVLIVTAAVGFAEGRVQQAIYALIGAALLLMAIPIARHLFEIGNGVILF